MLLLIITPINQNVYGLHFWEKKKRFYIFCGEGKTDAQKFIERTICRYKTLGRDHEVRFTYIKVSFAQSSFKFKKKMCEDLNMKYLNEIKEWIFILVSSLLVELITMHQVINAVLFHCSQKNQKSHLKVLR